ncbi:hybrid sensor histidine kinase/response regulator transcription factor [Salmonirosea aquatica]|uniref:histidine kinase n=1 Tax=Salmonirosea aquatica TaxID=2654236 RepID=A0A7C9BJM7_9BACT|nr:response regulator [Cytophagaceae bacterium SJW1-29]
MRILKPYLLVLILGFPAYGQISFAHLTTADGLSQSTVWEMVQDKKGFIWMATADGLNRYDGYTFKVYRNQPGQPTSLPTSNLGAIYADRHGTLWVGPRKNGLSRLREDGETFEHYSLYSPDNPTKQISISCFAEDESRLWIGTVEGGLFYYDFAQKKIAHWQDPRVDNSITAMYRDEQGVLWLGTEQGTLLALTASTGELAAYPIPFIAEAAPHHQTINVIKKGRWGGLWVGTNGRGLFQFDPLAKTFRQELIKPGVYEKVNVITDVVDDRTGNLWILTDYGAWLYPQGDREKRIYLLPDSEDERSLSTHALKKAFCDAAGNVWIGSWQGGVNIRYAQPERFSSFRHQPHNPQSLLDDRVTAVAYDRIGNLWTSSTKGLTRISADRNGFRRFTSDNSALAANDINTICTTPQGNLLISTWTAGFAFYDADQQQFTPYLLGGKSKSVKAFALSASGHVWIGTHERELYQFDERTRQLRRVDTRPLSSFFQKLDLNTLCEDSYGNLWIGTYNSGLLRWNPRTGRIRHFTSSPTPGSLGSNSITTLYEDSQKRLWIGTNGNGLQRFEARTEKFQSLTSQQGLANNFIAAIVEDEAHNLWLSTNGGISCFNPRTLGIENYDPSDGLIGREFLPDACARLPTGELAFGNMLGLVVFRPERVREKTAPPKVYLSSLKLFNRPVSPTDADAPTSVDLTDATRLVFRPSQSVFTIDFTALSFLPHRNIRYAYQLTGFDDDWNYVGSQRSAPYTNLHEGDYTFLVKAAIGNGDWSPIRSVQITVLPPWYRTWWAYSLYTLLLLGTLFVLRRVILIRERLKADIRMKQLEADAIKALDDAKTSFFTNISHEFRTPLSLILAPMDKLIGDPTLGQRFQHQFLTIQRNGQRLLRLINQLLDLSKLESQSLRPDISRNDIVPFVERIVHYFDELAENKQINLIFLSNFDSFDGCFDPDIVEKVVYNLLSNALKFTRQGGEIRVVVSIDPSEKSIKLTVKDSGIGVSEEAQAHIFERFYQADGLPAQKKSGSGIGLALTRELVELHRGRITVESTQSVGTTFSVYLPLAETAFPAEWLAQPADSSAAMPQAILPTFDPERPAVSIPTDKAQPILLVVEDNEELRQYLSESFATSYQVLTAAHGRQAISLAQKHIPDLILSDWLMPEMDGTELCQAIRSNEKTSHIPFLLLTSRSANQSQILALNTGIDDYMTKPFNLAVLETKVKSLIQNRQLLREKWSKKLLVAPTEIQLPPMEEQFIQKAVAIVETHIDDAHFDVEQLEQAMNMSRMQLYRKLKSIVNMSGIEFIRQVRLKRAVQLLESGHFNVSEVAWQVGFNDPAYFTRCFKKEFGKSPQEFQAKT